MGEGQGQSGQGGGFGNFMMNIGAPAAATIAAGMGPRYAASAAIGMNAINNLQDNKRRQKLGREVARLADVRAEADLEAQTKTWEKQKKIATAVLPEEMGFDDNTAMEYFGVANPLGEEAISKRKTSEFIERMPEPVKDEAYELFGSMAEGGDPEGAIAMMRDDDQFKQQLAMKGMDYEARRVEQERQRKHQSADRRAAGAVERASRQSEANYRAGRDLKEDEFAQAGLELKRRQGDRSYALEKEKLENFLPSKQLQYDTQRLGQLDTNIAKITADLTENLADPEEISAAIGPLLAEKNAILTRSAGATSYYDANGNLVQVSGETPAPPTGVSDTEVSVPTGRLSAVVTPGVEEAEAAAAVSEAAGGTPVNTPVTSPGSPTPEIEGDIEVLRKQRLLDHLIETRQDELIAAGVDSAEAAAQLAREFNPDFIDDYFRRNSEGFNQNAPAAFMRSIISGISETVGPGIESGKARLREVNGV